MHLFAPSVPVRLIQLVGALSLTDTMFAQASTCKATRAKQLPIIAFERKARLTVRPDWVVLRVSGAPIVFSMNIQTIIMALVPALLVLYVGRENSAKHRQVARAAHKKQYDTCLAAGRCPVCNGKPFDQILMNGCTGCIDCRSTGKANTYLARRV